MKKTLFFEVLDLLNERGVNQTVNISRLVIKSLPQNPAYPSRLDQVTEYLDSIKGAGYIKYSCKFSKSADPMNLKDAALIVNASLTINGFQFIQNLKRDESTFATNDAITKNSRMQTRILICAFLLSIISLVISYLNYHATSTTKRIDTQYLLPSKELIEQLKQKSTLTPAEKTYSKKH